MSESITLSEAARLISENRRLLVISHARPDGDTLGSAFGLCRALCDGIEAKMICADDIPRRLQFLSDRETSLREERLMDFSPDMIIAVDAAETALMGIYGANYSGAIDLKIDHHPGGSPYAKYNHIDGTAAATGELIYELILELERLGKAKLTEAAATALYTAISDDTGGFRYSNVTPKTMRIGAALMEAGANTVFVNHRLFECRTLGEITAQKLALDRMRLHRKGTAVSLTVTNEMKKENGLTDEDLGGVVSMLREIEGVELAVYIRQLSDQPNKFKISMRSGESVSSNALCRELGGGGHERAAGATVTAETPEEAEYNVMSRVLSVIGYDAE